MNKSYGLYKVIKHRRIDSNTLEITETYMRDGLVVSEKTTRMKA